MMNPRYYLILVTMMVMMRSSCQSAASRTQTSPSKAEVIRVRGGDALVIDLDLEVKTDWDVRWKLNPLNEGLSLRKTRKCSDGRCELWDNGSLNFSHVKLNDSGIYQVEVFDERGDNQMKKSFNLKVEAGQARKSVLVSVVTSVSLLLLLLLSVNPVRILFDRRRRRRSLPRATDPAQENIYMMMESCQNKTEKEAPKGATILDFGDSSIEEQDPADAEDPYV